jgi:preprotein translocase subunit SecD
MVNIDLIQQKLPQELREIAKNYSISDNFLETMSDIIILVLQSKSLDTQQEKQSWFDLLPLMNQEQVDKLRDILTREKQKLEEIEKKYEQKKEDVVNKYVQKFDENSYQNKIVQLKEYEATHKEKEHEEADALLNNL